MKISVKSFSDMERVKKPSAVLLLATRLVCHFFALFTSKTYNQSELEKGDWSILLTFIKLVISRQLNEILQTIK